MRESILIRFLYNTVLGRQLLKLLVHPSVSRASAKLLSSKSSRLLVPIFINKNCIDIKKYNVPEGGYTSFNEFFTRTLKEDHYYEADGGTIISPCEGLLTISAIDKNSSFDIKHTVYNIGELLDDDEYANYYQGGTAFIFRLTPAHYHRYIWSATGLVDEKRSIEGVLHSVRPICHKNTKVFIQNTRDYTVVNNSIMGKILQMEIGALLVGRISNYDININQMILAGQEKGYFEYGGSSIVVLTKDTITLSDEIRNRARQGDEIPVHIGEKIC